MSLASRTQLLGSYRTPKCRIGDIVQCAVRGDVRIVAISGGKIPWPIAQRLGERARGFVIYEGLEAALRRESGVAICHWWGIYKMTVSRWKKALGIGPETEGSRRLRAAHGARPEGVAKRSEGLREWYAKSPRKKLSRATRQKMREAHVGVPLSDEHRERIGQGHSGLKRSPAARKRIREGIRKHKRRATQSLGAVPRGG